MRAIAIFLPLILAACGNGDTGSQPGSVTQSEARELNEAAEMLDANSIVIEEQGNNG